MDYLSYIEDANAGINMDDYTIYNAIDALNSIQSANYDVLTQKMVGSQLNQSETEQLAESKALGQAIQNGDYSAGATSAGTLILGRQKAFDLATKTKDAIFGKSETADETADETAGETAGETAETSATPLESMTASAGGESVEMSAMGSSASTADVFNPTTGAGAEANTATGNVGELGEDTVAMSMRTATTDAPGITDTTVTSTVGEDGGIIADPISSGSAVPAFETSIPAGGIRLGATAEGSEEAEEFVPRLGEESATTEQFAGQTVASQGADTTALSTGTYTETGNLATTGYTSTTAESGGMFATEGTEMTAMGSSALPTTNVLAEQTGGQGAGAIFDKYGISSTEAEGGVDAGAGATATEAGAGATAEGVAVGTEVGVEAGATALETAGLALQAIPFADIIGAGLLIGGASIAPIMDAVDKKKEKKAKHKAKKKAKEAEQQAQAQYDQQVAQHNQAIQSLNSNHHSAITGGIQQTTSTAVGSASF